MIDGLLHLQSAVKTDRRGWFHKVFQESTLAPWVSDLRVAEVFFSSSAEGVIRGMHFQATEFNQRKIVSVLDGTILDVCLDTRPASPTYGEFASIELSETSGISLLVPPGVAHGFLTVSSSAIVSYIVSTEFQQSADLGVRFDSFGFSWPVDEPILSNRDQNLPRFRELQGRSR